MHYTAIKLIAWLVLFIAVVGVAWYQITLTLHQLVTPNPVAIQVDSSLPSPPSPPPAPRSVAGEGQQFQPRQSQIDFGGTDVVVADVATTA